MSAPCRRHFDVDLVLALDNLVIGRCDLRRLRFLAGSERSEEGDGDSRGCYPAQHEITTAREPMRNPKTDGTREAFKDLSRV
jgi:hypothetical protein